MNIIWMLCNYLVKNPKLLCKKDAKIIYVQNFEKIDKKFSTKCQPQQPPINYDIKLVTLSLCKV